VYLKSRNPRTFLYCTCCGVIGSICSLQKAECAYRFGQSFLPLVVESVGKMVAAKNGHSMTPGKKAAGKTPTKTAKSGGEVSDEQLDAWATEDAAAMAQLIALIPQVHLKPQDQGRQIAKKYMKKVKDTVSDKVARAATDKRAKKRAKFDGSEPAEGKADRYRQIACTFTYDTDNTFMCLYT